MKYMTLLKYMIAALSLFTLGSVVAAEAPATDAGVKIELNKLEEQAQACRVYLVFENKSKDAFSELKLDLMLFDGAGVVTKRLAVDGAPLRAAKTSVKLFEIDGLACPDISRILLNEVTACTVNDAPSADCIDRIETASRTQIAFDK